MKSLTLFILLVIAAHSYALEIDLPAETAVYRPSNLLGYQLVQKNCIACHSAQYVLTQPPTLPRSFWLATVHKMKNAFGAPIEEKEIPAMVDYLVWSEGRGQKTENSKKSAPKA